VHNNY